MTGNQVVGTVLACGLGLLFSGFCAFGAIAAPPDQPRVMSSMPGIGKPGGDLRMLVSRTRDTRLLYVYGNARLVSYNLDLELEPDILADYTVEDGRIFTFSLRPGHRWSDGEPFTTEDFRFYWEDIASNATLSPVGPPINLLVDGKLPVVEVVDELTIRYTWPSPNPLFLTDIAAASPTFIYAPAHYLKQFHEKYVDADELQRMVAKDNARDWAQLFLRRERMGQFDNPDLPTLQPWRLVTPPPAERFIAERNQYFHRVDTNGVQLPYIDRVILDVVDSRLIPIKTGAGDTDLQSRGLAFQDFTFLQESAERSGLEPRLWREARGAHLALYPNLNAADDVWRKLFRDVRFREALSIAIDRDALSQYLYFWRATPSNNTLLPESPLFASESGSACLGHDVARANALLDEIGLDKRNAAGVRLLPDGRLLELVVETAGEDSEQADVLELVRDDFAKLGFIIHTRPTEREVLRNRIFSGEALMTIWYGLENGVPTADLSPREFVPVSQYDQPQWPKWGQHFETRGEAGEAPDEPVPQRLLELFGEWRVATDRSGREAAWQEILELYAPQCYTIGLVANVLQPVAVRTTLRNVPEEAIYNWEPHAQIGIYRPDTFWYDN
jgi:peptide/nickel transport system substrate-binding protein